MNKYLSFECYCVEVVNIPYYNFLALDEYDSMGEEYVLYCKEHKIEYDTDYDCYVEE